MMNTRLSSLLVSGSLAFFGGHLGHLQGHEPTLESPVNGRPSVTWASLVYGDESVAHLQLSIPGFSGRPAIEVIPPTRRADRIVPERLVIDLPGVVVGQGQTRAASKIAHPFILASRLAQYVSEPKPVTRLVLELAPGVKAEVSYSADGVAIALAKGSGKVQASLLENNSSNDGYRSERESRAYDLDGPASNASADNLAEPIAQGDMDAEAEPVALQQHKDNESLPQIGAPYIGLPSLGSIPVAPVVAANVYIPDSTVAPIVPTVQTAKLMANQTRQYTGEPISIDVQNVDLATILWTVAANSGLNLIIDPEVNSSKGWTYSFHDMPWDEILEHVVSNAGFGMEVSNSVLRIARVEKMKKEAEDRKAMEDAKLLAGDLVHVTRGLSYAKVDEVQKILANVKSERGRIIIDQRTSTLFLSDLPNYVQTMERMIDRLDIKVPQVVIEARIVEANRNWQKELGVSWPQSNTGNAQITGAGSGSSAQGLPWGTSTGPSWNSINPGTGVNRPDNTKTAAFSPGRAGVTDLGGTAAGEVWLSFLTNRMSLNMIIQALERKNQIKVVSEPKLLGQNNASAVITDGSRIPYQANQSGLVGGAISVQFTDAELKMEVTPQITNDGTIILDVLIEKGQPDFDNQVNGVPTILRKQIQTKVLVQDGGTAILGGVFTNTVGGGTTGVPFLSKLPGIGWLFRKKTNNDTTTEMLVMISPKIMSS